MERKSSREHVSHAVFMQTHCFFFIKFSWTLLSFGTAFRVWEKIPQLLANATLSVVADFILFFIQQNMQPNTYYQLFIYIIVSWFAITIIMDFSEDINVKYISCAYKA